jgi:gas vesicle structural protein
MSESVSKEREIVLIDLLDRILYKGVILWGDITLSVADVDLVYLGLKVMLASVEKVEEMRKRAVLASLADEVLHNHNLNNQR